MDILNTLKIIRENKKMSRKDVSTQLNISSSLLSEIESGRTRLSLDIFIQLCEIYEINPLEIIKKDGNHYIILTKEDLKNIDKTIEILSKIQKQARQNININDNHGTININQKK